MQSATKQLWASVLAGIVGSLCCVAPLDKKTATVTFDPDKATSAKLTQATTEAGFPSKVISKP
jgi:copper chaperone CopZ